MKLSHRLAALAVAAILGMALLGTFALFSIKNSLMEDRRSQVTNMLSMAENMVKHYQDLEKSGQLTHEQAQAAVVVALTYMNNDGKSYFFAREPSGLLRVHPNPKLVGTIPQSQAKTYDGRPDGEAYAEAMARDHVGFVTLLVKRPGGTELVPKLNATVSIPAWNWWIGTGFYVDDIDAAFWRSTWLFLAISIAAALVIALLSWRLSRSIFLSLGGEPSYAASVTERIARGDLTGRVELREHDSGSLLLAMARMQSTLARTVADIRKSVDVIDTGTREIAAGNNDLSQRTEQQASSLQETAAGMEELTGTVKQNAENAKEARLLAIGASEVAQRGSSMFVRIVENMDDILSSVGRVATLVDEISTASTEQSDGISQIGSAVHDMDRVTQQNAALVEQAAAGAMSLANQARVLAESVAIFRVDEHAAA